MALCQPRGLSRDLVCCEVVQKLTAPAPPGKRLEGEYAISMACPFPAEALYAHIEVLVLWDYCAACSHTGGGIDDDECGRALQAAAGDTCSSLAAAAGITEQQLQELNEGLDCADLQPGDVVCVAETGGCCACVYSR